MTKFVLETNVIRQIYKFVKNLFPDLLILFMRYLVLNISNY